MNAPLSLHLLGRFERVKGPGLVLLFPFIQEMVRVDLRIQVIEIPSQDVISHDNVSMKVDAVLYFNVVNPERAIIQVQHYLPATNMLAQTTLRAVLGQHELDECSPSVRSSAPMCRAFWTLRRRPGASRSATSKSGPSSSPKTWCARSPSRRRPNAIGGQKSSTPKRSSRPRRRSSTRPRYSAAFRLPCSCVISR